MTILSGMTRTKRALTLGLAALVALYFLTENVDRSVTLRLGGERSLRIASYGGAMLFLGIAERGARYGSIEAGPFLVHGPGVVEYSVCTTVWEFAGLQIRRNGIANLQMPAPPLFGLPPKSIQWPPNTVAEPIRYAPKQSTTNSFGVAYDSWCLSIPNWILVFPLAAWLTIRILADGKTYLRRKAGLCVVCGYDLRQNRGKCPECGTPFDNVSETQESHPV